MVLRVRKGRFPEARKETASMRPQEHWEPFPVRSQGSRSVSESEAVQWMVSPRCRSPTRLSPALNQQPPML